MKCGAVALIISHFIAAILLVALYDWIGVIVNAFIFISAWSAFSTEKKCWATICAVFLFISAIYCVILTTMVIMSGNHGQYYEWRTDDGESYHSLDYVTVIILHILFALLKLYWVHVWIKIGKYFEQENQTELVISNRRKIALQKRSIQSRQVMVRIHTEKEDPHDAPQQPMPNHVNQDQSYDETDSGSTAQTTTSVPNQTYYV